MIMKKQLLLIVMLLSAAASAFAVEVKIDGLWYEVIKKGKVAKVIESRDGNYTGNIVIPEAVEYESSTYSVTSIGDEAFRGNSITSVIIPYSVTSIGLSAFNGCMGLTSITIPNSVTSLGDFAFSSCSGLTSVTIPNSVTSIGYCVFQGCKSLLSVMIPNSVTSIGNGAFAFCSGLTSVMIPSSVTNIGEGAFKNCSGLISVTIPNSVTKIGESAFYGCSALISITIPNSVTIIESSTFQVCSGLTSVTIPNSVTSIKYGAFEGCSSLTSITIPNSVTSVGSFAFAWCSSLTSVSIPNSVTEIGSCAFYNCSGLTLVNIGNGTSLIYDMAFANCPELNDVYCNAENVPKMVDYNQKPCTNAFEGSYIEYTTLHVPESSITAYETTEPWNSFKKIVKIMPMYTLTYMVDGEIYNSFQVEEGSIITPNPAPTKEGYTFSGWSEIPETMPAHDVTVTGTFSINMYKLTYTVDGEEYKSYEIEYCATITPEAEPIKEGYTFSGWSEIPATMPAHDVTVTGTFSINKYKLTYSVDGEEYKSYEVEYQATITPEEEPIKEGYTFSGWSEIPPTMPAHDVMVTGSFSINSYKLTYMIDDKVYKETMYEYGATIIAEPQPEGDYNTFEWIDLPQTMPAHDVVVYASYTSGIIEVLMASQHNVRIYSPNGKKLNKLQKGLNIIILCDGTIKKVIMK